ncbi:hypothetical protein [Allobaculum sp. JKK-2023]|uniref:hypothetical protein n=1 Tax=Allobaculum sp. JKK-2023 TaxID=3108943 RepID=UPI002B05D300|nr:hypothetical protein [Allobaculum sp. JKK-2023]
MKEIALVLKTDQKSWPYRYGRSEDQGQNWQAYRAENRLPSCCVRVGVMNDKDLIINFLSVKYHILFWILYPVNSRAWLCVLLEGAQINQKTPC